jgi:2-polyprenyl-3-methyl-5-hydroxy-6-metoxy-1,4-benzoquinol methylase
MNSFEKVIELIGAKSSLQKKRLNKLNERADSVYLQEANKIASDYAGYLDSQNIHLEDAVDSYLNMCFEMLKMQLDFSRTGKYPLEQYDTAVEEVYMDETEMTSYMIGLAMSQFLWENHYKMLRLFGNTIKKNSNNIKSYLEIGPGHGLYLKKAIESIGKNCGYNIVDISPASIKLTKSIINYFFEDQYRLDYQQKNIFEYETGSKFDFITVGEVLEHIECPDKLLQRIYEMLTDDGLSYVSTCANCPAKDHIYHYKTVEEIDSMITGNSFRVVEKIALPAEEVSMDEAIEKRVTVNYCAVIKKN